jgi:gamma-glutamylcyclotransferase (GGCT)/AIG2-like uncharacterized protein YtfP
MVSLGPFPYVRKGESKISGEVYEVSAETLNALDELEGHPNFYVRTPTSIDGFDELIFMYVIFNRDTGASNMIPIDGVYSW